MNITAKILEVTIAALYESAAEIHQSTTFTVDDGDRDAYNALMDAADALSDALDVLL